MAFALFCPCTFALNSEWQIYQYGHRTWKIDEGFLSGFVNAISQDSDGYLWVGTDNGLFRLAAPFAESNQNGDLLSPLQITAVRTVSQRQCTSRAVCRD